MLFFRKYAEEDIRLVAKVRSAYRILDESTDSGHYETHHPVASHVCTRYNIGFACQRDNSSYQLKAVTAGFAYSVLLVKKAREKTLEKFPDYLLHSWNPDSKGRPVLTFHSQCRDEARQFLSDQLHELSKDPSLFTTESCTITFDESNLHARNVMLVINRSEITQELLNEIQTHFIRTDTAFPVSASHLRFPQEIFDRYITSLTHETLELLNGADSILPLSDLDMQLLKAAEHLDIKSMRELRRAGANINCIGSYGETPLTAVIGAYPPEYRSGADQEKSSRNHDISRSEWNAEQVRVVGELLKSGADPNLYGYDGEGPLQAAVYAASPEIVELLLQCGANPNYSPFAEDSPWIVSQPLDTARTDLMLAEEDQEKERYERIVMMLTRHGAKLSASDDGLLYPTQPPYQLDSLEVDLMEMADDNHVFFLTCQLGAGMNQHKPGIFAPFFADDIRYQESSSGIRKEGLLTVIRHFEEIIDFMRFNFMANHKLFEISLLKPFNAAILVMHGLSKSSPHGIGSPVGVLKLEVNKEGKIQKIHKEVPPEESEIISECLFPGFSVVEYINLRNNVSGRIPPTQDVLVNVYGSNGLCLPDMLKAAKFLQDEYPCIQTQVISSDDREQTSFYDVHCLPSLDIFYRGRLMRRFAALFSCSDIIEGARQLFEEGFQKYVGKEGHGDHWGALGEASQVVEKLVPLTISQGEVESVDSLRRVGQAMTQPADKTVCSVFHSPEPLGLKVILQERDDYEKSYQLVTGFPAAKKGVTLPFTIREILPWENLVEGVLVGQLDDGETPDSYGEGATIGFFDTSFGQHYWRYRSGERLFFQLAALAIKVEKIERLTFEIDNQESLKRKYDLLGETPELDSDGLIRPDVYNMDGMKALMSGTGEYPEDCSFHMKISRLSVFQLENIPVIEACGPLFPTGPVEEGIMYIPQPVLPSGLVLSVGDNIRGVAWLHGRIVAEEQ